MTDEFDPVEYYERVEPVYEALGDLAGNPTILLNDNRGWYHTKDNSNVEELEEGWDKRARVRTYEDWSELVRVVDRSMYATTSYNRPSSMSAYQPATFDDGISFPNDSPTPTWEDTVGYAVMGDIDLTKSGDLEGDDRGFREIRCSDGLSSDVRETIEAGIEAFIAEWTELYGTQDGISVLDSGGGVYILGPPEATLPICREFAPSDAGRILSELSDRENIYLSEAEERVYDRVDGAEEIFNPDWLNNVNRQYKAPLSVHASENAVCTPIDTDDVKYELTRIEDVDEDLIVDATEWASRHTSVENEETVDSLVAALWSDYYDEAPDWIEALQAWLSDAKKSETSHIERNVPQTKQLEDTARSTVVDNEEYYPGFPVTDDLQDVYDASGAVSVEEIAEEHASEAYDTAERSGETNFNPSWRTSDSGESCFIVDDDENRWGDNGCNGGGGPEKLMYLGKHGTGDNAAARKLSEEEYWTAVGYLRDEGYPIPIWIPPADDEHGQTPFWAVKKAAVALEICTPQDFVEREAGDGGAYLGFPDALTYTDTLDALEEEGIDHGRARATFGKSTPYRSPEEFRAPSEQDNSNGENSDLPACAPDEPAGSLYVQDGCYGYWDERQVDGEPESRWKQVTNFLLETLEFVETDDNEEIRIRVHPAHPREEPYEVTVEPTVFNEARAFKEEVVIGRTTQFEVQHSDTLNELRETVGAQPAPERKGVSHLGAATADLDEFVTPNGVLSGSGWVDDPDHRYYAKAASDSGDESIVGEKWALSPEEDVEYDPDEVRKALKRLPNARLPDRALATLGWFYSAPVKPLIHDEEGEFNHLHVRGKTESGKTSFLQTLYQAFGMEPSPWSASSTNFSLEQLHVGSRGVPVWIDEYKPSDMDSRTVDKLHRFLRIATREGVWTKGRPDQSFMKFRLQSPVALSGEQQVAEPAVRRRMVQVNLSERATDELAHVRAYSELAGEPYEDEDKTTQTPTGVELRDHALAYYRFLLSRDADLLRSLWHTARSSTASILDEIDITLQDSEFQGAQTVVFGYRLYYRFAKAMGMRDEHLPNENVLRDAIRHLGENVGAHGQRREHGDEFLELVAQAAHAGYIRSQAEADPEAGETPAYRVYDPSEIIDEALALHMPTVFPSVKRYARDFNIEDDYNILQKSDYLDEFGDLAESPGTHIAATSHAVKMDDAVRRCVLIEAREAHKRLGSDFDLSAFGIAPDEAPPDEAPSGDDDNDGDEPARPTAYDVTDLSEASPADGYLTAEVEVVSIENNENTEKAPVYSGTLDDSTDMVDFVDFFGCPEFDKLETGTTYRIHGVKLEHSDKYGPQLKPNPDALRVEEIDRQSSAQGMNQDLDTAATDGGTKPEYEDATGTVHTHLTTEFSPGETGTVASLSGSVNQSPEEVRHALKNLKEKGVVTLDGDEWELL